MPDWLIPLLTAVLGAVAGSGATVVLRLREVRTADLPADPVDLVEPPEPAKPTGGRHRAAR